MWWNKSKPCAAREEKNMVKTPSKQQQEMMINIRNSLNYYYDVGAWWGGGVGGELKNILILEWSFKQIDPPGNITHFLSICFWQEIWFKEITQIWHRVVWQIGSCLLSLVPKCLSLLIHTDWSLSCIHPKSESPWSPDSANYLNFPTIIVWERENY